MVQQNTDFGRVADDLRRAATSFALLTSQATLLGAALSSFREFEKQIALTGAIARANAGELANLTSAARNFALVTSTTAVQGAQALQNLAQAGFDAQESISGLAGVLLLSQATATDVGVASDVLSSNIRAFNLETSDATRISNLFVAAQNNSLATVEKLTFALRQVGPVAEVAGINIEETTAFLGELFNIGLRGEQAGTSLRNVIVRLIRPVGEARDILQELGISTVDATGNFRGLELVLKDLANANLGEAQLTRIFEQEALAGAIALLNSVKDAGDGATSTYRELLESISGTNTALVQALKQLDTLDGSLQLLRNSFTDLGITIGEQFNEPIRTAALFVQELIRDFNDLDPALQSQIASFIGLSTALLGVTAVANALILILRGPFLAAIGGILSILATWTVSLLGLGATVTLVASRWAFFIAAIRAGVLSAAVGGAAALGAALLPIIGIVGAIGAAYVALRLTATESLEDIAERARRVADLDIDLSVQANLEGLDGFTRGASIAAQLLEYVGTETALQEAANRAKLAKDLINGELINLLTAGDLRQGISAARSAQDLVLDFADTPLELIEELIDETVRRTQGQAGDVAEQIKTLQAINADIETAALEAAEELDQKTFFEKLATRFADGASLGAADTVFKPQREAQNRLTDFLEGVSDERQALLSTVIDETNKLTDEQRKLLQTYEQARAAETEVLTRFFRQLAEDGSGTSGTFAQFAPILSTLDTNRAASSELVNQLRTALAETEDFLTVGERARIAEIISGGNVAKILAEIANLTNADETEQLINAATEVFNQGGLSLDQFADTVEDIQRANEREIQTKIFGTLEGALDILDSILRQQSLRLSRRRLDEAGSIEEALGLITENFGTELTVAIESFSARLKTEIDTVLASLPAVFTGVGGPIDEFIAGLTDEFEELGFGDDIPSFAEAFQLEGITEAISEAVSEADTIEEANAAANAIIERYRLFQLRILEELDRQASANGGEGLSDSVRQGFIDLIIGSGAFLEGATEEAVGEAQDRLKGVVDGLNRSASSANKIPEAVKRLREFEDQLTDLDGTALSAARSLAEVGINLDFEFRQELLRELDIADIVTQFDDDIRRLRRAQEDLFRNENLNTDQRDQLNQKYEQTISIIEAARDAEIEATDSFTEQMARRGVAIDAYIEKLRTDALSGEIAGSAAGAQIAVAEFNRDLVGIVDIWEQAVTSGLDSIGGTLADTIFEGENLLDGLKQTALDISRQVFENFTKAFLQSALGGIDGVFGNALNQALGQNEGIPGVGQLATSVTQVNQEALRFAQSVAQGGTQAQAAGNNLSAGIQTTATGVQTSGQALVSALQSIAARISGIPLPDSAGFVDGFNDVIGNAITGNIQQTSSLTPGELRQVVSGIEETANALGILPETLGALINFETAGTLNPRQTGLKDFRTEDPNDRFTGLIQFGGPEQKQFDLDFSTAQAAIDSQLGPDGAIVEYFQSRGFRATGDRITDALNAYSTILTGSPGNFDRGDTANGGAVSSVRDFVIGGDDGSRFQLEVDRFNAKVASLGDVIIDGTAQALPNPDQFVSLFESAFDRLPFEQALGFNTDSLRDGAQAGDVLSSAFDPNLLTDQASIELGVTLAQLNQTLAAAGVQLEATIANVGVNARTGGQQVQVALQQTSTGVRVSGTQAAQGVRQGGQAIGQSEQEAAQIVRQGAQTLGGAFQQAASSIGGGGFFSGFGDLFKPAGSAAFDGFGTSLFTTALGFLPSFFKDGGFVDANTLAAFAGGGRVDPTVYNYIKNFNDGGGVSGPGTGTSDSILARLSNGEFVINAKATQDYLPLLEAINNGEGSDDVFKKLTGNLPKFNTGGLVGEGNNLSSFDFLGPQGGYVGDTTPTPSTAQTGGQSVTVNATYNVTIGAGADRNAVNQFKNSSAQHAKDLARHLNRAKRNS